MKTLTLAWFLVLLVPMGLHSQIITNKINSGGICTNTINFEVGLIYCAPVYGLSKMADTIDNPDSTNFAFSPNPVNDRLSLKYDEKIFPELELEVYNENGQLVKKELYNNTIDLSGLPKGTYLILPSYTDIKPFIVLKT